jgi:aryl-alcohol dehydrogenase-like predicted oxidoreductase
MIVGRATAKGTAGYSKRFKHIDHRSFGRTAWNVSAAGFGCYRVSTAVNDHAAAMTRAMMHGINLIDTSTNYTDGASERLVGQVLAALVRDKHLQREQVVVVSKAGYLQGRNLTLSEQRKKDGRPFPDLVPYGTDLEHCIHPEFIADQLEGSLKRLQLETLDVLLLHNPEYYLGWAARQEIDLETARDTFYSRIEGTFRYLEQEVARGRIQAYGISANTFVAGADESEFVSLERMGQIARALDSDHHFRVIQFPMNLYESGAVTEPNQSSGQSLLAVAQRQAVGVMVNRPLNAICGRRMIRLAEPERVGWHSDDEVISAIGALQRSEATLWRKLLPGLSLPLPLYRRIKEQSAVADHLKHYWRNFGTWDRWRQARDGFLMPHIQGVIAFLERFEDPPTSLTRWLGDHQNLIQTAFTAVGSRYITKAEKEAGRLKHSVAAADSDWADAASLSGQAVRAIRSTAGISSVLVGMRQTGYVDDVLQELKHPVRVTDRTASWHRLKQSLERFR